MIAWAAQDGSVNHLYVARMIGEPAPVRVSSPDLTVEALHHPPRLAVAPAGQIYLSWSSAKPKPEGTLFASDLRLSRSLDGGKTFTGSPPRQRGPADLALLRRPRGGGRRHRAGLVARQPRGRSQCGHLCGPRRRRGHARGRRRPGRRGHLRLLPRGRGDGTRRLRGADLAQGLPRRYSRHGAQRLARRRALVRRGAASCRRTAGSITACPHRGGTVGIDGRGRIYATWYTEGTQARPELYFAISEDGRRSGRATRLHTSSTSIPDHARMAVDREGRAVIVWEDSTAVRRRILFRYTADGGSTLSPIQTLSTAIKAWEPDIALATDGAS